ncbi:hypothetical protein [Bradyrhizobium lupini]|uniref:hypothetical protein n=1 Tax=Rhizobium lupini TaxID=136996 RepID=UPI0034C5D853
MSFGRALGTSLFIGGVFMIWLALHLGDKQREERLTAWNDFVSQHACQVVERRDTPAETGFRCDDGVTYWKRGKL